MYLVYIENKDLLTKIITYFDYVNILYTTDINDKYDFLIVSQILFLINVILLLLVFHI